MLGLDRPIALNSIGIEREHQSERDTEDKIIRLWKLENTDKFLEFHNIKIRILQVSILFFTIFFQQKLLPFKSK